MKICPPVSGWWGAQALFAYALTVACAAEPVVVFEDNFDSGQSAPSVGSYPVFKAVTLPPSETDFANPPPPVAGQVLRLDRTDISGQKKVIALLDRPAAVGDKVRVEFDACRERGSALQFGFGSAMGGVAMGANHFYTIILSLDSDGSISVYNGEKYEKVPDVTQVQGQWQHYILEFVVGSNHVTLTAGSVTVSIQGPFASDLASVDSVDEVFFSTGSEDVSGQFDNLIISLPGVGAALQNLPVFGRISWQAGKLPFVGDGPRAGISGMGMCAAGDKIFLAGGFIRKGDGSQDVNRKSAKWVYAYDIKTARWQQLPDLPERSEYGRLTARDQTLYFAGGAAYSVVNGAVGPYLPSDSAYSLNLADVASGWKKLPSLSFGRTHFAFGSVGDRLLVAGGNEYDLAEKGYSARTIRDQTAMLDLSSLPAGWKAQTPLPSPPRGWGASATARGRLWVFGGVTFLDGPSKKNKEVRFNETLSFDPATNSWTQHAPSPLKMSGWAAATYQDRYIILIGGYGSPDGNKPSMNDQPLVYDIEHDRWMRFEHSVIPAGGVFNDPGFAVHGDSLFLSGGEGNGGSHFNHWLIGKISRPNEQ